MWLVSHGVPFHVAFRTNPERFVMTDALRQALAIMCAEFEGRKFNYDTMQFVEQT